MTVSLLGKIASMDRQTLRQIEQVLGYKFRNPNLLFRAFTHSSGTESRLASNERLEFLGDAVLALIICRALFDRFPACLEGDLTKMKSMLVSRRTCAKVAKRLGLSKYLKVGKGMTGSRALTGSLAAGLFEALVAVVYLDGGLHAVRDFVLRNFDQLIAQAHGEYEQGNFKSMLQQYAQQHLRGVPVYELLDEKGPDHDKCFESQVVIADRHFQSAWGSNKKQAEQKAAYNALVKLGLIDDNVLQDIH
jgi:ribonuclease-3